MKNTFYNFVLFIVTVIILPNHLVTAQSRCRNPNNRNGYCITIYDCPGLINLAQKKPLQEEDRRFLRESACTNGYGRYPQVCCTEDIGYVNENQVITSTTSRTPSTNSVRPPLTTTGNGNILPRPPVCGKGGVGDKIYNGNDTAIDEFVWMVLLGYTSPRTGSVTLNCGGSLINERYVLTAAHCVIGAIEKEFGKLTTVRLGEHDTSKVIDCSKTSDGREGSNDCADPIVEVGIEEIIPHESFSDGVASRHHDIALIRLDRSISYTYFIAPICLPKVVGIQNSPPGKEVVVAGWGRTLHARQSSIKQKLNIPIYDHDRCKEKFNAGRRINIIDSQLCAGGEFGRDSCDGDSGGPLMVQSGPSWVLEGIVSFGNKCGLEDWPAVYTRVSSYESWIKSKLRP